MAYCEVSDLLIGDIPTSVSLDPQKYVNDAADEIDSKIGFIYKTPIDITGASAAPRPVVLLLKRLNSHLASGRLIMAATILIEDKQLNAYGKNLVADAELSLTAIATRQFLLPGVDPPTGITAPSGVPATAPLLANVDKESSVEAFYDRIAMNPKRPVYPPGYPRPGKFVADF